MLRQEAIVGAAAKEILLCVLPASGSDRRWCLGSAWAKLFSELGAPDPERPGGAASHLSPYHVPPRLAAIFIHGGVPQRHAQLFIMWDGGRASGAPHLEPFDYAPLEANACGLPVVAVAEGGLRETVIDRVTGGLVEHSPPAMAEAIQRLISDSAYAADLGAHGRRIAEERWSLPAAIDRLEQRLREAIASGKAAQGNERALEYPNTQAIV